MAFEVEFLANSEKTKVHKSKNALLAKSLLGIKRPMTIKIV